MGATNLLSDSNLPGLGDESATRRRAEQPRNGLGLETGNAHGGGRKPAQSSGCGRHGWSFVVFFFKLTSATTRYGTGDLDGLERGGEERGVRVKVRN